MILGLSVPSRLISIAHPPLKAAVRLSIARLLASTHASLHRAVHAEPSGFGAAAVEVATHAPREVALVLECGV